MAGKLIKTMGIALRTKNCAPAQDLDAEGLWGIDSAVNCAGEP